jgi:anhydro-N-acetylmuramic acid kinase
MSNPRYSIIGLMSGTSGDGLDVGYFHYEKSDRWSFQINRAKTFPFPQTLGEKLSKAHLLSSLDLAFLDVDFGRWMGEKVKDFCEEVQIVPEAVCSHGHTVFHQPEKSLSLQIGNGWALHQACGFRVINDFRMLDVQLGGQGAPLVPIGDKLLFPEMDYCINLGGIANISMELGEKRIAFDCCPFNLLLNEQAAKLGASYDQSGAWAKEGQVNHSLLSNLNDLNFYKKRDPKSLGREDIEREFIPEIRNSDISERDILSTLVEHYAIQISEVIRKNQRTETPKVLLTGGGAYNFYFIERLNYHLAGNWIHSSAPSNLIEFKEAMIFGFLGVLRLREENNSLASVTGAERDSCGGTVFG